MFIPALNHKVEYKYYLYNEWRIGTIETIDVIDNNYHMHIKRDFPEKPFHFSWYHIPVGNDKHGVHKR